MIGIKFTDQQLRDLAEGKEVVTCDAVAQGEYGHHFDKTIKNNETSLTEFDKIIILSKIDETTYRDNGIVFKIGDVFHATNEKVEEQWIFSNGKLLTKKIKKQFPLWSSAFKEPLLVRLEKIEEKKLSQFAQEEAKKVEGIILGKITAEPDKEFWLKTWKAKN